MSSNSRSFIIGGIVFFFLSSFAFLIYTWIFNSNSTTKLRNYAIFNAILFTIALVLYIGLLVVGRGVDVKSKPIIKPISSSTPPGMPKPSGSVSSESESESEDSSDDESSSSSDMTSGSENDSEGSSESDYPEGKGKVRFCPNSDYSSPEAPRQPSTNSPHPLDSIKKIVKSKLKRRGLKREGF